MRRLLPGCLVTVTAALVINVAEASAADLLVLNGDPPVTLSGAEQYGIVYLDGELKLSGDTTIHAASIYIGPDAYIDSCYVPGSGDGQCTAGRSLTLVSSGPLTVATGIDLESGASNGPGGNLQLGGSSVSVAGQIDTSGATGFGSGSVTISSSGSVATQGILAPGAGVSISARGPILVGGAIQTQGSRSPTPGSPSTSMQPGGPITIAASAGDVDVAGAIAAQGQSAPSGGGSGGSGGAVTISGADVHAESISTVGGGSQAPGSGAGGSSPINVEASGTLAVSGAIDAAGASGAGGTGASGAPVNLKSGGTLGVGAVNTNGAQTAPAAPIAIAGSSVVTGDLNASGGGGSAAYRNGANAAPISVTAPEGATLGALLASGGNSAGNQGNPATPGAGAGINVVSAAGSISAGRVDSGGGSQGTGPGASGAPIDLDAADDLSVAGDVSSAGSAAGGLWTPPWSGGNAGRLFLSAATGTMNIGGNASAQGGAGSGSSTNGQLGGSGGAGAPVTLIAQSMGLLSSLSAAGGPGGGEGTGQGPGGPGGSITAYTDEQIFNSQRLVSSDGGDGNPTGTAGLKIQNSSPISLATTASGTLSFTSQSPSAARYLLETVDTAGIPKIIERTIMTTGLQPPTPVCQTVRLEVVAVRPGVGWTSDPSSPVSYTRQPSKSQTCSAPPKLSLPSKLTVTVAAARRKHWVEALRFRSAGIGSVRAALRYKTLAGRHATFNAKLTISRAGAHLLRLKLPTAVRAAGAGSVKLIELSPNGAHRTTHTLKIEVSA